MRILLLITLPLIIALACLGWHNQRRIDDLRTTQEDLTARMTEYGISLDSTARTGGSQLTKLSRPDREAEAKGVAAGLVAYAAEPRLPEDRSSEATRLRVLAESERVMSLDAGQLKTLIAELQASPEIDASMRRQFIKFAIRQLIKTHPQDALPILLASPDLDAPDSGRYPPKSLFADAVRGWAMISPGAAHTWLQDKRGEIPEKLVPHVETALIGGATTSDPRLALELFSETGRKSRELPSIIKDHCHRPEDRLAFLGAFRQWSADLPDGALDWDTRSFCLARLVYGDRPGAFETISTMIEQANLSPTELDSLTRSSFDQYVKPDDVGQWLEWLEQSWPAEYAKRCQSHLLQNYRTAVPAAEWLMKQPDSPQQRDMVRTCAGWAFVRDRDTGIRLALSLPEGAERMGALGEIYHRWPKDDPDSQAAAEAFAREHGINK